MANVYDPEKLKEAEQAGTALPPSDEGLRHMTGITADEEKEIDARAGAGGGDDGQVGKGYTGKGKETGLRRHFKADRNRAAVIFGGVAALLSILAILVFLILLPAKIYSIVQNMQRIFFSSSENAVKKMEQQELSAYVRKVIFPGLGRSIPGLKCPNSTLAKIDRRCFVVQDKGLFGNLFTAWKQGNLENRLAQDGMEFQKVGNNFSMALDGVGSVDVSDVVAPGSTTNIADSKGWKSFPSTNAFKAAVENRIDEKMQHASYYKKSMYRYKVATLLEKKYGIKMCIIACDLRRDFSDWKKKKVAAGVIRTQRILTPRNTMLTFVLGCILSAAGPTPDPACDVFTRQADPNEQPKITQDGCTANCIDNGEPKSAAEKRMEKDVEALAAKYALRSAADIAKATDLYNAITKFGFKSYLVRTVIQGALVAFGATEGNAKRIADAGVQKLNTYNPVLAAMQVGAMIEQLVNEASLVIPTMTYISQTKTMAQTFAIYRTFTDECKTGNCDPAIFGSFISSLGQGNQDPTGAKGNDIGGTAEAEHTPLYSVLLGDKTGLGASDYTCALNANNKPLPLDTAKSPVCPEEKVDAKPKLDLSSIRQQSGWNEINAAGAAINALSNITSYLFNKACNVPIIKLGCDLFNAAVGKVITATLQYTKLYKLLGDFFQNYILPISPVGVLQSGGRTFDMIAAGADVSGNDFAQHSLGGVVLSTRQVAEIRSNQDVAEQQRYNSQSFFAKMFDEDYKNSPISKVALAIPSRPSDAARTAVANFIANPLGNILHSFATVFGLHPKLAHAAATTSQCAGELMTNDPFCITQYGYPPNDPIFQQDPQQYWDKTCTQVDASGHNPQIHDWNQQASGYADSVNIHVPQNLPGAYRGLDPSGTNPCLLIMAAAGSGGAAFDTSVLSPDDLAGVGSSSSGGASGGGGGGQAPGDPASIQNSAWIACIAKYAPLISPAPSPPLTLPSNAIPPDGLHQYFGQMAYNGNSKYWSQADLDSANGGIIKSTPGDYIQVKYRAPPGGSNTMWIPTFQC